MKAIRTRIATEATTKDLGKWMPSEEPHGFAWATCTTGAESIHRQKNVKCVYTFYFMNRQIILSHLVFLKCKHTTLNYVMFNTIFSFTTC